MIVYWCVGGSGMIDLFYFIDVELVVWVEIGMG